MLDMLRDAGPMGWLILLVSAALVAYALFTALGSGGRGSFRMMLLLSMVPLLLGVAGMLMGKHRMDQVLHSTPGSASPLEVERGERIAELPLWLGGLATVAIVGIAGAGLLLGGDQEHA